MEDDVLLSTGGAMWLKFPPVITRLSALLNIFQSIYQICVGDWDKTVQKIRMEGEAEKIDEGHSERYITITQASIASTSAFEHHHCVKFLL